MTLVTDDIVDRATYRCTPAIETDDWDSDKDDCHSNFLGSTGLNRDAASRQSPDDCIDAPDGWEFSPLHSVFHSSRHSHSSECRVSAIVEQCPTVVSMDSVADIAGPARSYCSGRDGGRSIRFASRAGHALWLGG